MRVEVALSNTSVYPGFGSGLTNIAKHWFLIFIIYKNSASVTGGSNANATFAQSPNVVSNAI